MGTKYARSWVVNVRDARAMSPAVYDGATVAYPVLKQGECRSADHRAAPVYTGDSACLCFLFRDDDYILVIQGCEDESDQGGPGCRPLDEGAYTVNGTLSLLAANERTLTRRTVARYTLPELSELRDRHGNPLCATDRRLDGPNALYPITFNTAYFAPWVEQCLGPSGIPCADTAPLAIVLEVWLYDRAGVPTAAFPHRAEYLFFTPLVSVSPGNPFPSDPCGPAEALLGRLRRGGLPWPADGAARDAGAVVEAARPAAVLRPAPTTAFAHPAFRAFHR